MKCNHSLTSKTMVDNGSNLHYIRRKCTKCGLEQELKRRKGRLYNPFSNKSWINRRIDREKHAKDVIQPFMKNKPNPDFIKAYKDDDELLDNYYTKDELRKNE